MNMLKSGVLVCGMAVAVLVGMVDPPTKVSLERQVVQPGGADMGTVSYQMIRHSGDAELNATGGKVPDDSDGRYKEWGQVTIRKSVCDVRNILWPAAVDQGTAPPTPSFNWPMAEPGLPIGDVKGTILGAAPLPRRWSTARTHRVNLMPIRQGSGFKVDAGGRANLDLGAEWMVIETVSDPVGETVVQLRTDGENTVGTVGVVGNPSARVSQTPDGTTTFAKVEVKAKMVAPGVYLIKLEGGV